MKHENLVSIKLVRVKLRPQKDKEAGVLNVSRPLILL